MDKNLDLEKLAVAPEELSSDLEGGRPLLVFDLRLKENFARGHVKGSVHAVCDSRAKETIMPKIPRGVRIVLIDEDGSVSSQTAGMMASYGLDAHFLRGGIKSWAGDLVSRDVHMTITPEELWRRMENNEDLVLVDVRQPEEFSDFAIPGSINIPLGDLFNNESLDKIPRGRQVVTVCPHGNRSMVAAFALARNGTEALSLSGGLAGWGQVLSPKTLARDGATVLQVEKVGKGCLSYVIGSGGEALVVDPVYPAEKYIEIARGKGLEITKVIDTHQHADHVSAARDLAGLAGAALYMSRYEQYDFESSRIGDGDVIPVGESSVRAVHTPGHTPGSLSLLLDEKYLFTGDVLFVDGIGRPDLRDRAREFAASLYDTLHGKLLVLPGDTRILPAHRGEQVPRGRGPYHSTIRAAREMEIFRLPRDAFVEKVAGMALPRPMNYEKIIGINRSRARVPVPEVADLEIGPNRCAIATA